jgi:hypothetical protein
MSFLNSAQNPSKTALPNVAENIAKLIIRLGRPCYTLVAEITPHPVRTDCIGSVMPAVHVTLVIHYPHQIVFGF